MSPSDLGKDEDKDIAAGAATEDNLIELDATQGKEKPAGDKAASELKKPDTSSAAASSSSPEESVASLKAELEAKKKENSELAAVKARLEKANQEASSEISSAKQNVFTAREREINAGLEADKQAMDNIRAQLKEAMETGNTSATIELNEKMADIKFSMNGKERDKKQLEAIKTQAEQRSKEVRQAPEYTAATQAWIDKHPRFNTDNEYQAECYAADEAAQKRGIRADTPEYFKFVEGRLRQLGLEEAEQTDDGEKRPTASKNPPATSTAASVSREGAASPMAGKYSVRNGKYKASAEVVEMAEVNGYGTTPEGVARYIDALERIKQEKAND